ncbi:MAG TPA: glycosyltransferase [Polyangiaceae bacterium]|nr:glycosyltransferase [Polyangiaceae bacterium]
MRLRAVHVVAAIAEEASGPSYSVPRLCRALSAAGVETSLHVLARGASPAWADLTIHQHAEWPPPFTRLGVSPAMRLALEEEARVPSTLLHNHGLWMMPNVYPGYAVEGTRAPLVTSPRGVLDAWARRRSRARKRLMWALVQRRTLDRTRCFHATSESEHESIREAGYRAPVAVVPNGIDLPPAFPARSAPPWRLLFCGRVHPKKGVDVLLRAWSSVAPRFRDWELCVVGPDEDGYGATMRDLAASLGAPRVSFRGKVYGEEKWRTFAEANLFVLPTRGENFGLAVAEALASGVPAVVTRTAPWGGLEQRRSGWWIEPGVEPLEACLETALATSPEDLAAMGRRGRQWMDAEFSWPKVAERMARTYDWILAGGAPPPWVRLD